MTAMIHPPLFYLEQIKEFPPYVVAIAFFTPLTLGIALYLYFTRHARSWRKGVFPSKLKPTDDNFLEAFLALGAKLMLVDHHSMKGKSQFMNVYFNRYFRMANYNFGDSLVFSLKYPIQTITVTDWMKQHWTSESMRSQVVYFLVGLALNTGKVSSREMAFLKKINTDLDLPPENLQRIIAIYASYFEEQRKAQSVQKQEPSSLDHYYGEVLGVSRSADHETIKKAYRKLAKIHHPDNYATASESQQKLAAEKFIQIQKAYEHFNQRIPHHS